MAKITVQNVCTVIFNWVRLAKKKAIIMIVLQDFLKLFAVLLEK